MAAAEGFPVLLRRSRFASFDPKIRQTYYTPPAHAHRGDWGLKRPLQGPYTRRKGAYIAVPASFDKKEEWVQWERAENEVRWEKRFAEMEVTPKMKGYKGAGDIDSEFGGGEREGERKPEVLKRVAAGDFGDLGVQGPGEYGKERARKTRESIPNIYAMSPKTFERYVDGLRALRPAFGQSNTWKTGAHIGFLEEHTTKSFALPSSTSINQVPHATGGLVYPHLSGLHTHLYAQTAPGLVLQHTNVTDTKDRDPILGIHTRTNDGYIASFAGMSPLLRKEDAAGKKALIARYSETGIDKTRIVSSMANMRIKPDSVVLGGVPRTVATSSHEPAGLSSIQNVSARVSVVAGSTLFTAENPWAPGTPEYIGMRPFEQVKTKAELAEQVLPRPAAILSKRMSDLQKRKKNAKQHELSKSLIHDLEAMVRPRPQPDPNVLETLRSMVRPRGK